MRRATLAAIAVAFGTAAALSATVRGTSPDDRHPAVPTSVPADAKPAVLRELPSVSATAEAQADARVPAFLDREAETEGRWTLDVEEDGTLQLNLMYARGNHWGRGIPREDLLGLTDAQIASAASTPVAFRIEREAGRFELEGSFRDGEGAGHFDFHPDPGFAATLRSLRIRGADGLSEVQQMHLALGGASAARIRELRALDLGELDVDDLIQFAIFDITPEYVRSLRALGVTGTNDPARVVQMRVHRISAAYIRELEAAGYRDLATEQLLQMGIHGVSAQQVRELAELGFRGISARELVEMRIHRVTPEYIREMRQAGLAEGLDPAGLVQLRVHRITAEYLRALDGLGYRGLSRILVLQMGIHGVTPEFIREVRAAGFADVTAETLVRMKIHGIDSGFVRGGRRRG
jgi:hypothetical protein